MRNFSPSLFTSEGKNVAKVKPHPETTTRNGFITGFSKSLGVSLYFLCILVHRTKYICDKKQVGIVPLKYSPKIAPYEFKHLVNVAFYVL